MCMPDADFRSISLSVDEYMYKPVVASSTPVTVLFIEHQNKLASIAVTDPASSTDCASCHDTSRT